MEWRLSASLSAHGGDVRGVAAGPEGCALSASRDGTARLWHPTGARDFASDAAYGGHGGFVAAVAYLPPDKEHARGLVLTACHDRAVRAFEPAGAEPLLTFRGHEGPVCAVLPARRVGRFLSASWDGTAKVWSVDDEEAPLATLKGHEAVVWGVIELGDGGIATASADKSIFLWSEDWKKTKALLGHTDCVRALAVASPDTFLSCANDASIRLWSNKGDCLNTFFSHSNYIYSISSNPFLEEPSFVSCGEDSTIRIWMSGKNTSTITLPAQSVWAVAALSNGDIVSGSSDGVVRIFTRDPARYADDDVLKNFDEEVQKFTLATNQEIGGIKITDLPGPEILFEQGKTDGQTKLVRAGDKVKCYSWSANTQCWTELGEVTGSTKPAEGKQMFMGKEYDFVFNVDIEEGKPPIKLPYNLEEEPWVAAQAFIHKNNLPQVYLEQVANFIITNTKRDGVVSTDGSYADPFTGGSRYMPGSNATTNQVSGTNADPFTGSSSYSTAKNTNGNNSSNTKITSIYFPHKEYLRFEQANVAAIKNKIIEFNQKLNSDNRVSDDDIIAVTNLAEQKSNYNAEAVNKLKQMLDWPKDMLFPVLDILRLAIRNEKVSADIFDKNNYGLYLLDYLLKHLSPDAHPPNQLLSLRILTNAFIHLDGEMFVLKEHENVLSALISLQSPNKNMQVAGASLLLNMCIALGQQSNTTFLCQCLQEFIFKLNDADASFRGLVALGTLIEEAPVKYNVASVVISNDNFMNKLKSFSSSSEQKVSKCAKEILLLL